MSTGENIRKRRKALKLTLDDVATKVGISKQTLCRYETGRISNIPQGRLEALAAALQTNPSSLTGWVEELLELEREETESGRRTAKDEMYRTFGIDHGAADLRLCGDKVAVLYYRAMGRNKAAVMSNLLQLTEKLDHDSLEKIYSLIQSYLGAGEPIRKVVDVALEPYRTNLDDFFAG